MNQNQDILWKYYDQEIQQGINHETSRSYITNLILLITVVFITIITYDDDINHNDLPLAIFLIIIGVFGVICNAKYYERFNFHYSRATGYRKLLEDEYPDVDFITSRIDSDLNTLNRFKIINRIRLNWLWMSLNLIISLFGLVLTVKILCN
jgi:hypothetical protein|tara:strand:+ start:29795 stop:30247 length:453 start_codon:yes stop_codon:yes gene_type:complete